MRWICGKIAVLAPIPSARAAMAAMVKPGFLKNTWSECLMSFQRLPSIDSIPQVREFLCDAVGHFSRRLRSFDNDLLQNYWAEQTGLNEGRICFVSAVHGKCVFLFRVWLLVADDAIGP